MQKILTLKNNYKILEDILLKINTKKYMLVGNGINRFLPISNLLSNLKIPFVNFVDFKSNPSLNDVVSGVKLFNFEYCNCVVAAGGGSSIDVAKCIKLFCRMNVDSNILGQKFEDTAVPLVAIPTTAGTGSESTRFAVIYQNGEKQSIFHDSILPDYAVLCHGFLKTLPLYQKKCTMLDALCQGIESWWSVNSTSESRKYSRMAVEIITKYMDSYIAGNAEEAAEKIMFASNLAGRAINISRTTAPHAMSYKLTSKYGLPHGHAVAVCLPKVWKYMLKNTDKCLDERGFEYLSEVFNEIGTTLVGGSGGDPVERFEHILADLGVSSSIEGQESDLKELCKSVNLERLNNNPVVLSEQVLLDIYREIIL